MCIYISSKKLMLLLKIIYARVVILLFFLKKGIHIIRQLYCSDVLIYIVCLCAYADTQCDCITCHQLTKP